MKVINSIVLAESMQLVLADFALAALLVSNDVTGETEAGDISFNSFGYTQINPTNNSKVYSIKSTGFDNMVNILTKCMQ